MAKVKKAAAKKRPAKKSPLSKLAAALSKFDKPARAKKVVAKKGAKGAIIKVSAAGRITLKHMPPEGYPPAPPKR